MKLSVIIPTYNRAEVLLKTLRSFENQTFKDFELIVVSDGSTDHTADLVAEYIKKSNLAIRFFDMPHLGVSAARNFGIKKAKGEFILIINNDTMPAHSDFLDQHISYLSKDFACLGFIEWHPELKKTEVMDVLSPNGLLFNFDIIKDPSNCGWRFFYTSNISLHKDWFDKELFDESHPFGREDIELGYRLEKRGLRIRYNPNAKVFHYHYYKDWNHYLTERLKRKSSFSYLIKKHPELEKPFYRRFAYPFIKEFCHAGYFFTRSNYFRNLWWRFTLNELENQK